jgi:hypothetical protein
LKATDNLSGVGHTYYEIGAGAQQFYTAPFQLTTAGRQTVSYWSVDLAGNPETTKTVTVNVP